MYPLMSDRNYNIDEQARQLISPPPEETLRRANTAQRSPQSVIKRKRTVTVPDSEQTQPVEMTPNPKPRKQGKLRATPILESPTRPHSRRSTTPIPPYDPPKDVFTSPKVVYVTPSIAKSSKRRQPTPNTTKLGRALKLELSFVKKELPSDVDLLAPMPPPSPTEDPLLLSGSVQPSSSPNPLRSFFMDDLPPSSPPPEEEVAGEAIGSSQPYDWTHDTQPVASGSMSTEDSMMEVHPADADVVPLPLLNLDLSATKNDSGWSDSDDDNESWEGEGEYTGRWRMINVRTKADPPSSATRGRMEEWGRPISPYPAVKKLVLVDEEQEDEQELENPQEQPSICAEQTNNPNEEEQPQKQPDEILPEAEDPIIEPCSVEDKSLERQDLVDQNLNPSIDREQQEMEDYDDDGGESSSEEDPTVVKITSADPRAAAKVAAILKQHHYDCFTKIVMRQRGAEKRKQRISEANSHVDALTRDSRRRTLLESGISSSNRSAKKRRATLGMGVIGEQVYIPGSPAMTLPELLARVEKEVIRDSPVRVVHPPTSTNRLLSNSVDFRHTRDPFTTPSRVEILGLHFRSETGDLGERIWTKDDWKLLDACFTDERLEAGQRVGIDGLAGVDLVHVNDVVDRFVNLLGGETTISKYGPLWTRDNLLQRSKALQNKQRSGNVAPPTTPYTPRSSEGSVSGTKRTSFMEVPDFTPLSRRPLPPRKSRILPPAPEQDVPHKKIPATLMAPRYSHLMEEAIAISSGSSTSVTTPATREQDDDTDDNLIEESEISAELMSESLDIDDPVPHKQAANTIGRRVKGFLFSYLPTLSKPTSNKSKVAVPTHPFLPLPPRDVLEKPRGPIETPIRAPIPKPKHPKELVKLQPAPQPQKVSMIPRAAKPQRLVELHPLPPAPELIPTPRPRRSSGGSVKDLVRNFEELESVRTTVKPATSKLGWNTKNPESPKKGGRPTWKP